MVNSPSLYFKSWLKPGGQLLISDYCCGEKPWTPVFETYVKQRGCILYTPSQYGKVPETHPSTNYSVVCHRKTKCELICLCQSQVWIHEIWLESEKEIFPFCYHVKKNV